jgi:hypothetical protein
MKNNLLAAAFGLCALLALVGFTYRPADSSKWEYMVTTSRVVLDDKAEAADLNAAGLGGWELVAVEREGRGRTYFFKRPK